MLVDTNVLSELPKPRPSARVVGWLATQGTVHISVVTLEEISFGIARATPKVRAGLAQWFDQFLDSRPTLLDVTAAIARASGELRAAKESHGRPVDQADMLIAATALTHGLTLATRNTRHFTDCGISLFNPFE